MIHSIQFKFHHKTIHTFFSRIIDPIIVHIFESVSDSTNHDGLIDSAGVNNDYDASIVMIL